MIFFLMILLQARATAPNRRHLFLGQALLLGLFLLAGLSAAASLSQNPLSCAAFRLVGLPAALVFAALLVKCVFLLSLNSGVYLPAPYQVSDHIQSVPESRAVRQLISAFVFAPDNSKATVTSNEQRRPNILRLFLVQIIVLVEYRFKAY